VESSNICKIQDLNYNSNNNDNDNDKHINIKKNISSNQVSPEINNKIDDTSQVSNLIKVCVMNCCMFIITANIATITPLINADLFQFSPLEIGFVIMGSGVTQVLTTLTIFSKLVQLVPLEFITFIGLCLEIIAFILMYFIKNKYLYQIVISILFALGLTLARTPNPNLIIRYAGSKHKNDWLS